MAIDDNGEFVVTWTSYGQDSDRDGIYARRFNLQGGAVTATDPLRNEMLVNTTTKERQDKSDVATDANGNFAVVWESYGQDGSAWGIYGQRITHAGVKQGASSASTPSRPTSRSIRRWRWTRPATLSSPGRASARTAAAMAFTPGATTRPARRRTPSEFQVNNNITVNWQVTPDVDMDASGNFVVTWSSFGAGPAEHRLAQQRLRLRDLCPGV